LRQAQSGFIETDKLIDGGTIQRWLPAAQRAGLSQVSEICRQTIPEEERMAEALLPALPAEVSDNLFEEQSEASWTD